MDEQQEDKTLFELERKLKEDTNGTQRDALLMQLEEQALDVKRKMDAGVPADEFADLNSLYKALEAAARVVAVAWRRLHPA